MASSQYLQKRGGTWSVVLDVPKKLRGAVGERRFVKALHTSSLSEANVLKLPYLVDWQRRIKVAAKTIEDPESVLMVEATTLQADYLAPDKLTMEHRGQESSNTSELRSVILERAEAIAEQYGPERGKAFAEVATGNATLVSTTYSMWLEQCLDAEQTKVQHTAAVKRFIAWGGSTAVIKLPRKRAGEYINDLLAKSGLTRRTVERHASSLSSLWRWYVARGMADENPWRGHQLSSKKLKKQHQRRALSDESLLKLLGTRYGNGVYRQLHPDLLRIGLVTGARIEALCALKRTDVTKLADGYWFSIERDKTEAGERLIPVHHSVDHIIERRLKDEDTYLFKGLIPGGIEKKRSHHVSKAYARFRKAAGVDGNGEVFHSLRNTFIECMEGLEVPESTIKLYVGHKRSSMTYGHYSKGTKVDLRAVISKLDYGPKVMKAIETDPV